MGQGGSQSPRVKARRSKPYATPPYNFHVGIRAYTGTSISYLGVSLSQSFFIAQIGEVPDQGSHTTKQPRTNPSSGVTGSSSLQGDVGSSESLALGFLYSHRRKEPVWPGVGLTFTASQLESARYCQKDPKPETKDTQRFAQASP